MRGFTTGFLLVWIVLLRFGNCNYAEILWGQCYAFCLTRHEARQQDASRDSSEGVPISTDSAIRICRKDRSCKWCLYACERPKDQYPDHSGCLKDCQNRRIGRNENARQACNDSCGFISRSSQSKFGSCPAPADMEDFSAACVQECGGDLDCDGMSKCCNNDCGYVCHKPLEFDVFPPIPASLQFKERHDGGMVVEWGEEASRAMIKPVIYVLRWWCPYTRDVLHSITTKTRVKLKGHPQGVRPAAKCNFMVAAMNIRGSRGFSPAQVYIKKFLNPSPPINLETTRTKLHDGKVDVTIRWQPPRYTDGLPVSRYLVYWSDALPPASPDYLRLHMHKKSVSADRTSYSVQRLEPGTTYFLQVRAVVKWKGKSIRGKPVSTYIEAYSAPQPAILDLDSSLPDEALSGSHIYNITVRRPIFVNSQLTATVSWSVYPGSSVEKYILYWTPDVCDGESRHRKTRDRLETKAEATTHKREFMLFNLRSACVYELWIHTVNFLGESDEGRREYFSTPSCEETQGHGKDAECPHTASAPVPPTDLSVRFKLKSRCMCQAVLSWERPFGPEGAVVNQFSILWGQSRAPPDGESGIVTSALQSSTIVYNTAPYRIQVPGNDTRACMTYLERSRHYTAQVVAQASKLKSPPAVLHFVTPEDMAPCYDIVEEDSDLRESDSDDFLGSVEKPGLGTTEATVGQQNGGTSGLRSDCGLMVICVVVLSLLTLRQRTPRL